MDTYDKICMWCVDVILMRKEEYKIFKSILLSWECSEQEKKLIDNMIGFVEKMRNPQHEPQHEI